MSNIFGRINTTQEPVSSEQLNSVAQNLSYWLPDNTEVLSFDNLGMGILELHTTALRHKAGNLYRQGPLSIVCEARIDNLDELATRLSLNKKNGSPSQILLEAYKKWGIECAAHILGDFAFALYDETEQCLLLARDPIGIKPLFYFYNGKSLLFGSNVKSITEFHVEKPQLNALYLGQMLTGMPADKAQCCYQDIHQLEPGHTLLLKDQRINIRRYWDLNPGRVVCFSNEQDYIEGLQEKIKIAVERRIKDVEKPGCELSGGLDSSAVFSYAHASNPKVMAFSHVMDEEDKRNLFPQKDERAFIDALLAFRNSDRIAYVKAKDEDLISTLKKYCYIYDGFTQSAFHLLSHVLYKEASAHDTRVLLSGFGGDELVSSKAHGFLNELASNRDWKSLYHEIQNRTSKKHEAKLQFIKKAVKAFLPIDALSKEMEALLDRSFAHYPVSPSFSKQLQLNKHYRNNKSPHYDSVLSQKQYEQVMHAHVPQRLSNCALAAQSRRIEYRYPLLDVELMEYYLALPASFKQKNGIIRYPFRMALEGYVPEKIQWRTDKSFHTIPTFFARYYHNFASIARLIEASDNKETAQYIQIPALKKWSEGLLDRSEKSPYTFKGIYNYLWFLQFLLHEK